jgi:hypothetical protein
MFSRLDKSWVVFTSIENEEHDRCVDVFSRPDGTFGFEEFRRDPEDRGDWTPVNFYSDATFPTSIAALASAERAVPWLTPLLEHVPSFRRLSQ